MMRTAFLFPGWSFSAGALAPIARALGIEQIEEDPQRADLWIAWSLGALHAMKRAGEKPMICLSATARFLTDNNWPGMPPANLRALRALLRKHPESALESFHRLCAPDAGNEIIRARVRDSLALGIEALEGGLRELGELDVRADMARIAAPTLFLHGARDTVICPDAGRATARLLQGAVYREHPRAAHDLPLAHLDWVVVQARDFLASIRTS